MVIAKVGVAIGKNVMSLVQMASGYWVWDVVRFHREMTLSWQDRVVMWVYMMSWQDERCDLRGLNADLARLL